MAEDKNVKKEDKVEETITLSKEQAENVMGYLREVGIEINDPSSLGNIDHETFKQRSNATFKNRLLNSADGFYSDLREDFKSKKEGELSERIVREIASSFLLGETDIEGKTVNQVIEIAHKKVNLNQNEREKELQNQLIERNAEIDKLRNEEIPTIKKQVESEKDEFYKNRLLLDSLSNLNTGEIKSTTALRAIERNLNSKYKIEYDREGNSLRWIDKNTGMEAFNADKGMRSTTDILADELRAENLLSLNTNKEQTDNTPTNTEKETPTYTKTPTVNKVNPKALKREEELKKKQNSLQ